MAPTASDPGAATPGSGRELLPDKQTSTIAAINTSIRSTQTQFDSRRCQLGETPPRPHAGSARSHFDDDTELRDPAIDRAFVALTEALQKADNDYARMLAIR